MPLIPDPSTSDSQTVDGTSRVMTPTMGAEETWRFICTTDCYIAQHPTAPVVAVADGNMFWPAKVPLDVGGRAGAKLAVIQASVGGTASLTRLI